MLKMVAQVQSDQLRPSLITQLDVSISGICASFSVLYGKEKEKFVTACLKAFPSVCLCLSRVWGNRSQDKEADFSHYQIFLLANMLLEV